MTLRYKLGLGVLALAGMIVGGCSAGTSRVESDDPSHSDGRPRRHAYRQIELLSRPAVKEVFEAFSSHDKTNRSEPYADKTIKSQILELLEDLPQHRDGEGASGRPLSQRHEGRPLAKRHDGVVSRLRIRRCHRQQVRRPRTRR